MVSVRKGIRLAGFRFYSLKRVDGLAGFRAGYGFAHENLIQNLMKVKLPFEPSYPAQVAAMAALDDISYIQQTVDLCHNEMKRLMRVFQEMEIHLIIK